MSSWLLALAVGIVVALIQYGARDPRSGAANLVAALLRVGAVTLLVALLLDAPSPSVTWIVKLNGDPIAVVGVPDSSSSESASPGGNVPAVSAKV